jgi:vacuolar-type H+-ATPase subunit I/STV1
MGMMWFAIGLIVGVTPIVANVANSRFEIDLWGWLGMAVGEFMILFAIAWTVASFAEGEPRAASMGAIMFGAPGLVAMAASWRLFARKRVVTHPQ